MIAELEQAGTCAAAGTGPDAFFKVRLTRDGETWLAWGGLQRLECDDPACEPTEPVYFQFGPSGEAAVEALIAEIEEAHGPRRWWRQPCGG